MEALRCDESLFAENQKFHFECHRPVVVYRLLSFLLLNLLQLLSMRNGASALGFVYGYVYYLKSSVETLNCSDS
jgi:hypothetical protein